MTPTEKAGIFLELSNQRIKFAPSGRPIRKSEALLLSAYAQRYVIQE